MYDKLIERSVNFLYAYGKFSEDREIVAYGIELLIMYLVNAGSLLILGLIFGCFIETLLFLICLALLQSYSGGYHALTHLRCFLLMLAAWGTSMLIIRLTIPYPLIADVFALICLVTVYRIAPVKHKNYPMSAEKEHKVRKTVRIISCALCGVVLISSMFPKGYFFATVIGTSLLITSISMIGAYIKQLRENQIQ